MLAERRIDIALERSTTRPLTEAETRQLLGSVDTVLLLRGSALRELPAKSVNPADLRGPTGKIRAPLVKVGRTLLAGFRLEALEALLDGSTEERRAAEPVDCQTKNPPSGSAFRQVLPSASRRKA